MSAKVRPAKCSVWLETFKLVFAVVLSPNSRASVENALLPEEQIQVYKDFLNSYPSKAAFIDIPRKTAAFDDAPTDPCTKGLIFEVRPESSRETHLLRSNIIGENEHFRIVDTELKSKSLAQKHRFLRLSEIVFDVLIGTQFYVPTITAGFCVGRETRSCSRARKQPGKS
jgi:hypothetical protein